LNKLQQAGGIQVEPEQRKGTKERGKRGRRIALAVGAVAILAIVALVVMPFLGQIKQRRQALAAANAEPGQTAAAFIGDLSAGTTASGQLLPQREAQLALGISGQVEEVYVQVGDAVQADDILIQLEDGSLERAVRSAEQNLAIQEANLAELRRGASEEDIAVTEASLESAEAGLANAQAGLVSAKSALTQAELSREALQDADITAEASLKSAQAALVSAQAQLDALLEDADAETVEEALLNLEQARNSLWNAQLERDATNGRKGTPDYMRKQMDATVANAEIAVRLAEISYLQAQEGATDEAIAASEASVAAAELQVTDAQAQWDDIDNQIAQADVSVVQAKAGVAQADASVLQAEAAVAQAEANLASLLAGASEEQIAVAEAQVAQARISLEDAQDNLTEAALAAPFDGLVTDVYVTEGEWANGPAIELVDTGSLEVVLDMDEIDIGAIAVGQPTLVTLEAWPDEELTGQVVAIAPKAKVQSEIVTYEVHLRVEAGDLPVLTGMTANAELITAERENVLLVPNRAITADREAGKYYVNLVEGDSIAKTEVTIGLRDKDFTEITGGLEEGDELFIGEIEEEFRFGPEHRPPEGFEGF
jgi:HlyD family secretion protein